MNIQITEDKGTSLLGKDHHDFIKESLSDEDTERLQNGEAVKLTFTRHKQSVPVTLVNKAKSKELPNNLDIEKLGMLLAYSDRYELDIQFCPEYVAVYVAKDGVNLIDFGGGGDFAIDMSLDYLKRINRD